MKIVNATILEMYQAGCCVLLRENWGEFSTYGSVGATAVAATYAASVPIACQTLSAVGRLEGLHTTQMCKEAQNSGGQQGHSRRVARQP